MGVCKRVKDLAALREIERLNATVARQQGIIDYVAVMADVDIPTDEEVENAEPEQD